jgi:hypothetical protein
MHVSGGAKEMVVALVARGGMANSRALAAVSSVDCAQPIVIGLKECGGGCDKSIRERWEGGDGVCCCRCE